MRRLRPELPSLAALVALTVAFFAPVLSGRFHLPRGGGDLASFLYPMYRFAALRMRAGDLPLWNPHQDAGWPIAADIQSGMLYPPHWPLFLLRPSFGYDAVQALVMAHVLFAGIAMYACLRLWHAGDPLRRAACLVGAAGWMLNDVFITHLGNLNFNAVAAWWPLALLGLHRAIDAEHGRERVRWWLVGGAALGVGTLAGHAQVTWMGGVLLALYALARGVADRRPQALLGLLAVGALGAGIAAVVWAPAMALTALTARAAYSYGDSLAYALPPAGLVGLFSPGFWGRGAAAFFGAWDRVELGYVGVLPWLLAVVAIVRLRARRWVFWALLGLLGILLALGDATPVHRLLLGPLRLPFRAPARYLLWTAFAIAQLAALGLDHLQRAPGIELTRLLRRLAAATASLVLAVSALGGAVMLAERTQVGVVAAALGSLWLLAAASVALLWAFARSGSEAADDPTARGSVLRLLRLRPARSQLGALAFLLVAVDLVLLGAGVEIERGDPAAGYEAGPAVAFLQHESGRDHGRIDIAAGAWQPGAAQVHGLYALSGVYNPLRLATFGYALDGLQRRGSRVYDLFGVRWVVTDKGQAPTDLERDPMTLAFDGDPRVDVWRNDEALPRAMLVAGTRLVADDAEAYARLHDAAFDPRAAVLFAAEQSQAVDAALATVPDARNADAGNTDDAGSTGDPTPAGTVAFVRYEPDNVVLEVDSAVPAWLLLTDVWHPGWRATIDGEAATLMRGDFTFRALRVPPGRHRVAMRFMPPGWRAGLVAGGLAWLVVAGGWWVTRKR